jgi:precorrin-2 dehydrogenase/sirohydrochlorin ferrochelatase
VIPLLHDFRGTRVLVVGGGRVGARRAHGFAREAEVVIVSPDFVDAEVGDAQRVRARVTRGTPTGGSAGSIPLWSSPRRTTPQ